MHARIREKMPGAKILYGGSVNSGNALALLSSPFVDGVLVGGASLEAVEFQKIVSYAHP